MRAVDIHPPSAIPAIPAIPAQLQHKSLDPRAGPTVDGFVTALSGQPGLEARAARHQIKTISS
jgi:hypothetical protein